jgi:hypothetical protein
MSSIDPHSEALERLESPLSGLLLRLRGTAAKQHPELAAEAQACCARPRSTWQAC